MTPQSIEPVLSNLLQLEEQRQRESIRLIASENYASAAVRECSSSVLMNKYSEGYPGARYYEGQQVVDRIERLALERATTLFGADHANVQPYSGSPANLAIYAAFLKPGDTILSLALDDGGHLTHGSKASITGRWFQAVHYRVDPVTGELDYEDIARLARTHRPKMILCGHSAWPRIPDFAAFRTIADEVGAWLWVDMAHFAGLVAGGAHPNPVPFADVVTTTTHKTLRGPRGGMILCKSGHAGAIDKAVFPGTQGGPHNHTTAAIAQALHEAAQPSFGEYARQVVANARVLARSLKGEGMTLVTGGTDNHIVLVDFRNTPFDGKTIAEALDAAGMVTNANKVPGDTRSASRPSGIRLGTAALTTRGMGTAEMETIARWIGRVLESGLAVETLASVREEALALGSRFPVP